MYNEYREYFKADGQPKFTAEDLRMMPTGNLQVMHKALSDRQFALLAVEEDEYRTELKNIESQLQTCKQEMKRRRLPC